MKKKHFQKHYIKNVLVDTSLDILRLRDRNWIVDRYLSCEDNEGEGF